MILLPLLIVVASLSRGRRDGGRRSRFVELRTGVVHENSPIPSAANAARIDVSKMRSSERAGGRNRK